MDAQQTRNILEACMLVAGKAMSIGQLESLFESDIDRPDRNEIREALAQLRSEYEGRGIELVEVASGWRLQTRSTMAHWVARLFQEKTPRYSRALLETLVLIAYRQPITRGEIEEVRGVAVSSNIIKTLQEREWIKEIGYKDVPGKPALWGTTRYFLDYFNLKRLDELPTLAEARSLEEIDAALAAAAEASATDIEAANDAGVVDDSVVSNEAEATDDAGNDRYPAPSTDGSNEGTTHSDENGEDRGNTDSKEPSADSSEAAEADAGTIVEAWATDACDQIDASDGTGESGTDGAGGSDDDLAALASGLSGAEHPTGGSGLSDLVDRFLDDTEPTPAAHPLASLANRLPGAGESSNDSGPDAFSRPCLDEEERPESEQAVDRRSDEPEHEGTVEIVSAHDLVAEEWRAADAQATDADPNQGAEWQLRQTIDEFAGEHRRELEAQREYESRTLKGRVRSSPVSEDSDSPKPVMRDSVAIVPGRESVELQSRNTPLFGLSGVVRAEYQAGRDETSDGHASEDSGTPVETESGITTSTTPVDDPESTSRNPERHGLTRENGHSARSDDRDSEP